MPAVEVLELSWDEIEYKEVSVVDCETGEELVNVQKFRVHDEPMDKKQSCYAIEIYDDSLEGDDLYIVDEVDDMEVDEVADCGKTDVGKIEADVGKTEVNLTRVEPMVGVDFDGGFEIDLPKVQAAESDVVC